MTVYYVAVPVKNAGANYRVSDAYVAYRDAMAWRNNHSDEYRRPLVIETLQVHGEAEGRL